MHNLHEINRSMCWIDWYRLRVHNFWTHETRLPTGTVDRLVAVLRDMYSPDSESQFLSHATNLLLEMTSRSPDYNREMFEQPLSQCKFHVSSLSVSTRIRRFSSKISVLVLKCIHISGWLCKSMMVNNGQTYPRSANLCQLHGTAPPYMTSQFTRIADMSNRRRLRSASSKQLDVPSFCPPTVGSRAFPIAGAKVWNSLPDDVTSAPSVSTFWRHLKTYLFRYCYNTDWYCLYLLWL